MTTVRIAIKTSPQNVDWSTLDGAWAAIGAAGVFDAVWLNDHITNMEPDDPGPSFEALTTAAALAHHVPGLWIGHAVLSNTFRHPVLVAKAATVLDHATGGRFILGLGAGWFEGEHEPFGIHLPPLGERIDRWIAAVEVIRALGTSAAAAPPGVTRPDPHYPLAGATNQPPPVTPGGPPIWLGGQGPRGIALAARVAAGWVVPGLEADDPGYLAAKRDALLRAMEAIGRDPTGFDFGAQVTTGTTLEERRAAVATSLALVEGGATHLILALPARLGASGVEAIARDVAIPLREALGLMALAIRIADGDADLERYVELVNAITPEDPASVEEVRWSDATYPGGMRLLAEVDGRAVGAANAGRIYVQRPDYPDWWGFVAVEPAARGQGVGSALLLRICDAARVAGKHGLQGRVSEARPEAIAFLAHRGFVEDERSKSVRLELIGRDPPDIDMPAGTVLTDLAARPDLVDGVHAVALETFVDIPWTDEPMAVGDLAEFRARDVDRPGIPPGAFMVALDAASDEVVGYASLMLVPGSTTAAWHDMTAVRRAWRGRGLATALKRATIRWAIDHGLEALDTGNDEHNAPMRAVNARLGYRPLPDEIFVRGPLLPPADGRDGPDGAEGTVSADA